MAALSFNVHSATTFKRTSHPYLSLFIIVTHHSLLITLSRCTWPQPSKELLFIIVTHHSQSLISSYTLLFIIITHIFQGFPSNQTWNLSKNLHRRILRLKILHRQFHLILTVLVGKTQKKSENGEIYSAGKNFTLLPALTAWKNSTSVEVVQVVSRGVAYRVPGD